MGRGMKSEAAQALVASAEKVAGLQEIGPTDSKAAAAAEARSHGEGPGDVEEVAARPKIIGFALCDIRESGLLVEHGGGHAGDPEMARKRGLVPAVDGAMAGEPAPDGSFIRQVGEDPVARLRLDQIGMGGAATRDFKKPVAAIDLLEGAAGGEGVGEAEVTDMPFVVVPGKGPGDGGEHAAT